LAETEIVTDEHHLRMAAKNNKHLQHMHNTWKYMI